MMTSSEQELFYRMYSCLVDMLQNDNTHEHVKEALCKHDVSIGECFMTWFNVEVKESNKKEG